MTVALVGYTGFVGSNLLKHGHFDFLYNSKNIEDSFGLSPDELFFCGIPAEKYIANNFPQKDLETIKSAMENIKRIEPKRIVLISTVDVYDSPIDVNENDIMRYSDSNIYGKNRRLLEQFVIDSFDDYLIVRLPALYGIGLKKNFIFDMMNRIPRVLNNNKFCELGEEKLSRFYTKSDDNMFRLKELTKNEEELLTGYLKEVGFSSLNFTDSRSSFQFYNLKFLYEHIEVAKKNSIKLLNVTTEPCNANELYSYIFGEPFINEVSQMPANYDMKSIYSELFGGNNGYFQNKDFVKEDLKNFIINFGS